MGAYLSTQQCRAHHNVTLSCNATNSAGVQNGGIELGEFQANPDVAGIGVIYAFFSIACLALITSGIYLILQLTGYMEYTGLRQPKETVDDEDANNDKGKGRPFYRTSWAEIFEATILSCSDQQVFTSGAYALTLGYAQGCKISAYHYNIVANMMLITCATHLMSVTVVSQYWKHKLVAILRTLLTSGLYMVTGILLSNQGADKWPSFIPKEKSDNLTALVIPAMCFQSGKMAAVSSAVHDTVGKGANIRHVIVDSTPNNHIQGWNFFVLMILWYGGAVIADLVRLWYRRGLRGAWHKWGCRIFWFYQFVGAVFSSIAIVMSYIYIRDLRSWMNGSGWIHKEDDQNPENDATSFGQLVPLLLILFTVFTLLQLIGDKFSDYAKGFRQDLKPDPEKQRSDSPISKSSIQSLYEKKEDTTTAQDTSVPPTPPLKPKVSRYQSGLPELPSTDAKKDVLQI
ncbi:MAG: hypothetical protein M1839_002833 [Geoglossum umbratile]|nr:MAG: hypothetical protein M1839_002833 [Geoglossum umbratile]